MDEVPGPGDSWKAYRVGPRCGGGNLGTSPQGDPGGARRRPRLRYSAGNLATSRRFFFLLVRPGFDSPPAGLSPAPAAGRGGSPCLKGADVVADGLGTPRPGTDGNHSCGY